MPDFKTSAMIRIQLTGIIGMDSIVDLTESRKARSERSELFRTSAKDLLMLLERQRTQISEEFMTFLLALAVSDQALHYSDENRNPHAGQSFLDNLFNTAQQIYETHSQQDDNLPKRTSSQSSGGRVLDFMRERGGQAGE
jgi:hypothetical protein